MPHKHYDTPMSIETFLPTYAELADELAQDYAKIRVWAGCERENFYIPYRSGVHP